jgi:EAL domain-containing protein (putative c-di-GMP-specific phosphodiesterase class I)
VAEGVESEAQLAFLKSLRCDEYQGYYMSRPVEADVFSQLLRQQNVVEAA